MLLRPEVRVSLTFTILPFSITVSDTLVPAEIFDNKLCNEPAEVTLLPFNATIRSPDFSPAPTAGLPVKTASTKAPCPPSSPTPTPICPWLLGTVLGTVAAGGTAIPDGRGAAVLAGTGTGFP